MTELISELLSESAEEVKKIGKKQYLNYGITKETFEKADYCYALFNFKNLLFSSLQEKMYFIKQLSNKIKTYSNNCKNILVVGLGNRHISADSLGSNALKHVIATRNLLHKQVELSAISTSVLGLTGIESADLISAVSKKVNADLIILIDTLCANNYNNLGTNFQISNGVLNPGAGIGNNRKKIKKDKIAFISIGVPLVVYAKNFVELAIDNLNIKNTELNFNVLNKLLKNDFDNLVLTLKDIDSWVKIAGEIIGYAINMAVNNFSIDEQKSILQSL